MQPLLANDVCCCFTVVQLAWDTWTTYRGIGGWEITKLIKSNANLIPTKATLINVSFHVPLPPPPPPTHTHTNILEPQLHSLKNFLSTAITDHANSTYCSTKHSNTRPHTVWNNGNDPKSQVNRHTYHQLGMSIRAHPSPPHSHQNKLTHIHNTMTHLC